MSEMTTAGRPILDRIPEFDPRSREHPIRPLLTAAPRVRQVWTPGVVLDQGREGACVGFGWTGEAIAEPVVVDLTDVVKAGKDWPTDPNGFALRLYHEAQKRDDTPGVAYVGTSVLAGAKTMKALGLLPQYRWAFGTDDVIDTIVSHGPVVLGINWHEGMYDAPGGRLTLGGPVVGGHCILACGYDPHAPEWGGVEAFLLRNSWGDAWGIGGSAWLRRTDLDALLAAHGEGCVPVRRALGH